MKHNGTGISDREKNDPKSKNLKKKNKRFSKSLRGKTKGFDYFYLEGLKF